MSDSDFESSEFAKYAAIMRQSESSNNYSNPRNKTHLGAYQMSPQALQSANFQDKHGNWTPLARSYGVTSDAEFDDNKEAQDAAFENFTENNFDLLRHLQNYVGRTIDGVEISESGLLAAAHLVGAHSTERFLESNGRHVPHDDLGTSVLKYIELEAGLNFTFDSDRKSFAGALNVPLHSEAFSIGNQHSISVSPIAGPSRRKVGPKKEGTHQTERSPPTTGPTRFVDMLPWLPGSRSEAEPASPSDQSLQTGQFDLAMVRERMDAIGNQAMALATSGLSLLLPVANNLLDFHPVGATNEQKVSANAAIPDRGGNPLPDIAPIRRRGVSHGGATSTGHHKDHPAAPVGDARAPAPDLTHPYVDQFQFSEMLSRELDAQARLPPSGPSGFDPRLSPAWPGMKLPN